MRTKFYTGAGDKGSSIFSQRSFSKDNPFFEFLGTLDELNSWLGLCASASTKGKRSRANGLVSVLRQAQEILFVIQAEAAGRFFPAAGESSSKGKSKKFPVLEEGATEVLLDTINRIDAVLPPITKFIIPGGSELSAMFDVARAIARRTERLAVKYSKSKKLSGETVKFLNRLSSLLFALARYENFKAKIIEQSPSYS